MNITDPEILRREREGVPEDEPDIRDRTYEVKNLDARVSVSQCSESEGEKTAAEIVSHEFQRLNHVEVGDYEVCETEEC